MAEKEASTLLETDSKSNTPPNPLFSIVSKFTQAFNFPFPPPPAKIDVVTVETEKKGAVDAVDRGSGAVEESKAVSVKFPDDRTTIVAPLKLEAEETEKITNPVVLWQVYAIGGFFVLRWVWGRWNGHKANKKSSSPPSSPSAETNNE